MWKPALKKLFSKKESSKPLSKGAPPPLDYTGFAAKIEGTKQAFDAAKLVYVGRPYTAIVPQHNPFGGRPRTAVSQHKSSNERPQTAVPQRNSSRSPAFHEPPHRCPPLRKRSSKRLTIHPLSPNKNSTEARDLAYRKLRREEDSEERGNLLKYPDGVGENENGMAAYVPTHAATDAMHLMRKTPVEQDASHALDILEGTTSGAILPSEKLKEGAPEILEPTTRTLSPFHKEDDDSDFQAFLKASRIAATMARDSCGLLSPYKTLPRSSHVMDNILIERQVNELYRPQSSSALTTGTKASNRRSFIESVGQYIKPTQPQTVYVTRPAGTTDKKGSKASTTALATANDKKNAKINTQAPGEERSKLSKVSGPIQRSLSRDRGKENDARAQTSRELGPRRKSILTNARNPALNREYDELAQAARELKLRRKSMLPATRNPTWGKENDEMVQASRDQRMRRKSMLPATRSPAWGREHDELAQAAREQRMRRKSTLPPAGNPTLSRYNHGVVGVASWV
jgi:hypothetical protein